MAVQDAGGVALVPAELAAEVTRVLHIPTVGAGAGPDTDAQVLVWTDMLGRASRRVPKFVKKRMAIYSAEPAAAASSRTPGTRG